MWHHKPIRRGVRKWRYRVTLEPHNMRGNVARVPCVRGIRPDMASQDLAWGRVVTASLCIALARHMTWCQDFRMEPRRGATTWLALGVFGYGIKAWHHIRVPWRHGPWCQRTWRQDVLLGQQFACNHGTFASSKPTFQASVDLRAPTAFPFSCTTMQ